MTGRAESVGFNNVGAGSDIFPVNFSNEIGVGEIELVVTAVDVDTLGVQHGPHRAVNDVNAITIKQVSEVFHSKKAFFVLGTLNLVFVSDLDAKALATKN